MLSLSIPANRLRLLETGAYDEILFQGKTRLHDCCENTSPFGLIASILTKEFEISPNFLPTVAELKDFLHNHAQEADTVGVPLDVPGEYKPSFPPMLAPLALENAYLGAIVREGAKQEARFVLKEDRLDQEGSLWRRAFLDKKPISYWPAAAAATALAIGTSRSFIPAAILIRLASGTINAVARRTPRKTLENLETPQP